VDSMVAKLAFTDCVGLTHELGRASLYLASCKPFFLTCLQVVRILSEWCSFKLGFQNCGKMIETEVMMTFHCFRDEPSGHGVRA
jgi:hypothetical protein